MHNFSRFDTEISIENNNKTKPSTIFISCNLETMVGGAVKGCPVRGLSPRSHPGSEPSLGKASVTSRKHYSDPVAHLQWDRLWWFWLPPIKSDGAKMENRPSKVVRQVRRPLLEDQMEELGQAISTLWYRIHVCSKTGGRVPSKSGPLSVRLGDRGLAHQGLAS